MNAQIFTNSSCSVFSLQITPIRNMAVIDYYSVSDEVDPYFASLNLNNNSSVSKIYTTGIAIQFILIMWLCVMQSSM